MELHFARQKMECRSNFLKIINPLNFFRLSLSLQIVLSILVGVGLGVILRYYPNLFHSIGIKPSSFQQLGNLFIKMVKNIFYQFN